MDLTIPVSGITLGLPKRSRDYDNSSALVWNRLEKSPEVKDNLFMVCSYEQWSDSDGCVTDYTVYIDIYTKNLFVEKHLYFEEAKGNQVIWFSIGGE